MKFCASKTLLTSTIVTTRSIDIVAKLGNTEKIGAIAKNEVIVTFVIAVIVVFMSEAVRAVAATHTAL